MPRNSSPPSSALLDSWGRANRVLLDVHCARCGITFRPRRATNIYCSRACLWAGNGGQNRKPESWWTNQKGYIEGRVWEGGQQRRVKQHVFLMEQHLGRHLLADEDVHHRNGIKTDNRIENLEVIDHGQHASLSNRARSIARAPGAPS